MFFEMIMQYIIMITLNFKENWGYKISAEMREFETARLEGYKGNIDSQYKVGHMLIDRDFKDYTHNFQTKQEVEAVRWLKKAANNGHAEARYELGNIYKSGIGQIYRDDTVAFEWYEKAAHQNHFQSQYELSHMHYEGIGTRKDSQQGDEWAEKYKVSGKEELKQDIQRYNDIKRLEQENDLQRLLEDIDSPIKSSNERYK